MKGFWTAIASHLGGRSKEGVTTGGFTADRNIAELDISSTLQLTRQTMTLSRRRRCAGEHLDAFPTEEGMLPFQLSSWYAENGFNEQSMIDQMSADLKAVSNNPTQVSDTLKKRVLLTKYFSRTGDLEDCYDYGNIEPFVFESDRFGKFGLRETLHDIMSFPQRVEAVISFDPEPKGSKHQIRYFRALLASYAIAHYLHMKKIKDPHLDIFLSDEVALARSWVSLVKKIQKLSIDPYGLSPDESLLYERGKVSESAMLFNRYSEISEELLKEG